jgi:hypothetical protein
MIGDHCQGILNYIISYKSLYQIGKWRFQIAFVICSTTIDVFPVSMFYPKETEKIFILVFHVYSMITNAEKME